MSSSSANAQQKPLLERLAAGVVVADGAMGTMLYSRGVFLNRCFDELNLSGATLVQSIHEEYVEAGAELLETNTFGANRLRLAPHGLDGQVRKVNREGVRIAREAAKGRALVYGALGPLGKHLAPIGPVAFDEAVGLFREQTEGLDEGGVDGYVIETMPCLEQARAAIEGVRQVAKDATLLVLLTFNEDGKTSWGESPEDVVAALESLGVPVVGANCSQGPAPMLETAKRLSAAARSAKIAVMPNAGMPAMHEGRYVYLCTPEYMSTYARQFISAGVSLVGGCCGTTPAHIKDLIASVKMVKPGRSEVEVRVVERPHEAPAPVPRAQKTAFSRKLSERFVISVEIDPPRGADPTGILEKAKQCHEAGIDAINVADGPRASARMSAQSVCLLIQQKIGIETILHYTCRDRNLLGIQSDLLGCHAIDLRNVLIITGDPPKMGDYPDATAVYDVDSVGLLRIADHLNHGCDLAGNLIGPALGLHLGCGADPSKPDMDREVERLEQKVKAGAEYVMTQPVYDLATLERFLARIRHLDLPVLVGILPLYSHKNAEFLHNEVPGMVIPEPIRERMRKAGAGPAAQEEGVRIAQEATRAAKGLAQGVYVMPPFNRVDLALRVAEAVR